MKVSDLADEMRDNLSVMGWVYDSRPYDEQVIEEYFKCPCHCLCCAESLIPKDRLYELIERADDLDHLLLMVDFHRNRSGSFRQKTLADVMDEFQVYPGR